MNTLAVTTPQTTAQRAVRWWARLLEPRSLGAAEIAVVGTALAIIGILLALPHIRAGSFYQDDWGILSVVHFPSIHRSGVLSELWLYYSKRPGEVLYYALLETTLGFHVHLQLLLAALLVIADAVCLFALLRMLRFATLHAATVALLALLFPFSDSLWLWPILTMATLTTALYLLGVMLALRAFELTGRRAVALHGVSFALYIAGILSYEVFGALGCLVGLLYLPRVGFARARRRWAIDVAGILSTLVLTKLLLPNDLATPSRTLGIGGMITHAGVIVRQGLRVLAYAAEPYGRLSATLILAVGALLVAATLIAALTLPAADVARARLRRWLGVALGGAIVAAGAWAIYVPAITYYSPGALGTGNRVNALAGPGIVLLVFGVVMAVATLVVRALPRMRNVPWAASAIAVCVCAVIAAGYARRDHRDIRYWDSSASVQREILRSVHATLPALPDGATVFVFNHARTAIGWMPAFVRSWDLSGALRFSYGKRRVAGIPINANSTFSCSDHAIAPTNEGYGAANRAYYGLAFFEDVRRRRAIAITDRASCRAAVAALAGGTLS